MENQVSETKIQHRASPSTVSTSIDSIAIDSPTPLQMDSQGWLDQLLQQEGVVEITETIQSMVENDSKLINTLNKSNCILSTRIYLVNRTEKPPEIVAVIDLGNNIESHPNVVHGGFSATLVDNCLGVLAAQLHKIPVTKTLNLAYKRPIQPGQTIVIISKVKESERPAEMHDRSTLISEIFNLSQDLLLTSEAVFVDISNRVKRQ
ncbi:thioesterase family protein [Cryptosporidium felis]|nr:thioesterase family protein [Cryptosporidium felis]